MKEHKKQILAALALAFVLGAAAPTAVFAANESTGAGANAGETVSQSYAESIAKLYNKIQKDGSFANYRAAVPMIQAVAGMEEYLQSAQTVLSKINGLGTNNVWDSLNASTRAALAGKTAEEAVTIIKETAGKEVDDYTALKTQIDTLSSNIATAKASLVAQVKAYYATDPGVDNMSSTELIAAANKINGFDNYVGLYNAMKSTDGWVTSGTDLTAAIVESKLASESLQKAAYDEIANAAVKVSPNALDGLITLPNTSAPDEDKDKDDNKPSTPNTGIVGLFESGALDLGTLTLIVSVALASAAGLALIAKLYLKHKF